MTTNKLLVVAVLAIAIGAPIAGFVGDATMPQPATPTGVRVPFLHGLPVGPIADSSALASLARADAWPDKPVRLIVPFPAGGATDVVARLLAQKLAEAWHQGVVVEDRVPRGLLEIPP